MAWYESKISKRSSKEKRSSFLTNAHDISKFFARMVISPRMIIDGPRAWVFSFIFIPLDVIFLLLHRSSRNSLFEKNQTSFVFNYIPHIFILERKTFSRNFLFRVYESSSSGRYKYARFSSKILPISRNNNINLYRFIRFDQIVGIRISE